MKTLIIPCAGHGNRMSAYFFPKALLPLEQRAIVFQIIDFWKAEINQVILVVNGDNHSVIKAYFDSYFSGELQIDYCVQEKPTGTYFAVKNAMSIARNRGVILNWSDVCLHRRTDEMFAANKNLVFLTDRISCRWRLIGGEFFHDIDQRYSKHGVLGVFVIDDASKMFTKTSAEALPQDGVEYEILECLDVDEFQGYTYESTHDIGDTSKYSLAHRRVGDKSGVRAFGSSNEIVIKDDVVIKNTSNDKLRNAEEAWYKNAKFDFTPQVISYNPLTLERLDAVTAHDKLSASPDEAMEDQIITRLFKILKQIHLSKEPVEADFGSSYDQYYAKTVSRLTAVDFLFSSFNRGFFYINGKRYENPLVVLQRNKDKVARTFSAEFRFIHGDLQLSNTLIDEEGKLFVIDPRGYFGRSSLMGDPIYDFAKAYYGFCGNYGAFSVGDNHFSVTGEKSFELKPLLSDHIYSRRRQKFFQEFEKVNYVTGSEFEIDLLQAIIWLSAAEYTANDVLSCMYAYLLGTVMINECFT